MAAFSGPTTTWHRLTEPHPSVTDLADRRRAQLAAGLLLVLIPLAAIFAAIYAHPVFVGQGDPKDALSIGALVAFLAAYPLVRSRWFRAGVLILVLAPLVAVLISFGTSAEQVALLYFTAVPVLLGGLLLDFRNAAALAALNLAGASTVGFGTPTAQHSELLSPFLFLVVASSIILVGAGFLQRSIRDTERANQRLQTADAYRLQLLNTIVHDLNTPLTPLSLRVDMMDETSKDVVVMRRNIKLLQRLIDDIADLAKIESDRLRLDLGEVDIGDVASQAAESLQHRFQAQEIDLHVRAPAAKARVDGERITQVFYNLLTNAIKFTPAGGRIELHVEPGPISIEARVRDTGRGLVPPEIERLFQPFSQVHDRSEASERGTGLGLFITKAIVEAHGGRVWVRSDGHGHGSTFGFSVPVAAGA